MKNILWLIVFIALTATAEAQVTCFTYSNGMVSCNTPTGTTSQIPFGSSGGWMQGADGEGQPYTIMPPLTTSQNSQLLAPMQPLAPLAPLPYTITPLMPSVIVPAPYAAPPPVLFLGPQ